MAPTPEKMTHLLGCPQLLSDWKMSFALRGFVLCGFLQTFDRCRTFTHNIRASNAVIIEACGLHERGAEQVPAIHHNGIVQKLFHTVQVKCGKVFPFREYQAGVRTL